MAQQQAQGMDPYAMAHMGGGAHPHDMVMGADALGGQPMGAASMLPGGVGSPPPHHPMGMYQYPDHSGEDLGSYVVSEESPVSLCLGHCSPLTLTLPSCAVPCPLSQHDPDLGYYDSRRSSEYARAAVLNWCSRILVRRDRSRYLTISASSRLCTASPAVGDLKRRADEAFTEPIPTLPTNASDDWER
jgi:hypothetical protein